MHRMVVDTSALVAYWREEPGAEIVRTQLRRGGCVMHEVNASEFAFTMPRKMPGTITTPSALAWLEKAGIAMVGGFDRQWAEAVAEIRTTATALNLGDGVAVALASVLGVPVLTAEKAFNRADGFAKIELIR